MPFICMIHGEHGSGKTHFAKTFPNPLFVGTENLDDIIQARLPKAYSWEEFISQLKYVRDNKKRPGTLVVDSLDGVQSLMERKILKTDGKKIMNHAMGGFGKAWDYVNGQFVWVIEEYFEKIINLGINLVLICHTGRKQVDDLIMQETYTRYETKLYVDSKGVGVGPTIYEWIPNIFFLVQKTFFNKKNDKNYADTNKERMLYTTASPSFNAKNRINLPDQIIIPDNEGYNIIKPYIDDFYQDNEKLKKRKEKLLELMTERITSDSDLDKYEKIIKDIKSSDRLKRAEIFIEDYLEKQNKGELNE